MNFDEKLAFYWLENRMSASFVGEVNLFGSLFVSFLGELVFKTGVFVITQSLFAYIPHYSSLDNLTHHAMILFKERH